MNFPVLPTGAGSQLLNALVAMAASKSQSDSPQGKRSYDGHSDPYAAKRNRY